MEWELQVRIHLCSFDIGSGHFKHWAARRRRPTLLSIEDGHVVADRKMHHCGTLSRSFVENIDRNFVAAEISSALLHPSRDFLNCTCATQSLHIFCEQLIWR